MQIVVVFVLLAAAQLVCALNILSPLQCATHIPTPIFSVAVGAQTVLAVVGRAVVSSYSTACTQNPQDLHGRVVFVVCPHFTCAGVDAQRRLLECVERAGGLGVVRMMPNMKVAGFTRYITDRPNPRPKGEIPFVCAAGEHRELLNVIESGENVTVALTNDENPWEEMWQSTEFLIAFRVVLPLFNVVGCLLAVRGIILSLQRIQKIRATNNNNSTQFTTHIRNLQLMCLGCVLELAACGTRVMYFALAPLFCSANISTAANLVLLFLSTVFEAHTNMLAVSLFLRWGAFGRSTHQIALDRVLIVSAVAILGGQLYLALESAKYGISLLFFVISIFVEFAVSLFSAVIFLWFGRSFVRTLRHSTTTTGSSSDIINRALVKAVRWIQISATIQVAHVVTIVVARWANFTVWGFFAVFVFHLGFFTAGSLAQTIAFAPARVKLLPKLPTTTTSTNLISRKYFPQPSAFWREHSVDIVDDNSYAT